MSNCCLFIQCVSPLSCCYREELQMQNVCLFFSKIIFAFTFMLKGLYDDSCEHEHREVTCMSGCELTVITEFYVDASCTHSYTGTKGMLFCRRYFEIHFRMIIAYWCMHPNWQNSGGISPDNGTNIDADHRHLYASLRHTLYKRDVHIGDPEHSNLEN